MHLQNNIGLFDDTGIKNTANVEDYPKVVWCGINTHHHPPVAPQPLCHETPSQTRGVMTYITSFITYIQRPWFCTYYTFGFNSITSFGSITDQIAE